MSTPEKFAEETTCTPSGKLCWAELITSDPKAAIAYYEAMFGWETEVFADSPVPYTMSSMRESRLRA